jgi:ABC-type polysaccharide/polyol phosphate transport system ATPase subunit
MSGILIPTKGRVRVWGKITPVLGIGAGFNQDLTGRENTFMYSAILGNNDKETAGLFDQIVQFAELEEFIDSPLRIYSTGMIARLGFAIAMAKQPEIILIDEVLAVGDESFQEKCKARF